MRCDQEKKRFGGKALVKVLAALVVFATCVPMVSAQGPQRYQPSRPTVSPYMNLLRRNASPVPNYYSFVRPMQRQAAFNQQQATFNQQQIQFQVRQNAENQQLQADLMKAGVAGPVSGASAWFQNPGSRSTFLNTSQYFSRAGGR
ncbi:hypothetical protein KOR34_35970 [Posidoniimonas corsicana]|uniref:Uncharacterized protein n=1 Tax=Posidoniimonas corsicana TaxID=1938618 RepID=A0A5C5V724_9BACT|nr:hypothetical protein [Posidoniimonas corsicana]TWT33763.1 hypothetical protein KOR34_35970 [Posidoniimonas corsicana]